MNKLENHVYYRMLKRVFIINAVLSVCAAPVVYAILLFMSEDIYLLFRLIKFISMILIGFLFCRKREEIVSRDQVLKSTALSLSLIFVSLWLEFQKIPHKFYLTVSSTIGIYNQGTPLFLTVLWEQIFSGDLYWSMILCPALALLHTQLLLLLERRRRGSV